MSRAGRTGLDLGAECTKRGPFVQPPPHYRDDTPHFLQHAVPEFEDDSVTLSPSALLGDSFGPFSLLSHFLCYSRRSARSWPQTSRPPLLPQAVMDGYYHPTLLS